jgi:hypothetical protein
MFHKAATGGRADLTIGVTRPRAERDQRSRLYGENGAIACN